MVGYSNSPFEKSPVLFSAHFRVDWETPESTWRPDFPVKVEHIETVGPIVIHDVRAGMYQITSEGNSSPHRVHVGITLGPGDLLRVRVSPLM